MSRLNVANFRHPDGTADNINLDNSARVLIGTSSTSANCRAIVQSESSDAAGSGIFLLSRGNNSPASAQALGQLWFTDSAHGQAASIEGSRDGGTWTSGSSQPSKLTFSTTADGASSSTERMRITSTGDLRFNSGYGSVATAYGCRAWCNADLTGSGSIRDSGNVSSLTDRGTGRWQFHFATAMPDTNYAAIGMQKPNADVINITGLHPNAAWDTYTTGTVAFLFTQDGASIIDPLIGNIAVFR